MKSYDQFIKYEKEVAEFKLRLIKRLSGDASAPEETLHKRTSHSTMIETVMEAAGKPLHVNDIDAAIEKEFAVTLDRDSLSSAILKQVRKEKRFVRVAPNTFGLRQT